MPNIFIIGCSDLRSSFTEMLISSGFAVNSFDSFDKSLQGLPEKAHLVVIDAKLRTSPRFKEFLKVSKNIPKLVISDSHTFRGLTQLLKQPFTYPLFSPGVKELVYFTNRLLREKSLFTENSEITKMIANTQRELAFFQEVSKMLISSLELGDIITKTMKKVKEMIKAETWSVLLVDQDTGDLVFERTEGRKAKKIQKLRLKMGEGIAGWVAQEGIPLVVPDVSRDERFLGKIDKRIRF